MTLKCAQMANVADSSLLVRNGLHFAALANLLLLPGTCHQQSFLYSPLYFVNYVTALFRF